MLGLCGRQERAPPEGIIYKRIVVIMIIISMFCIHNDYVWQLYNKHRH